MSTEKKKIGFAAWSPEKLRATCRQGGIAAHAKGTAHKFNADEARVAGSRGGVKVSGDRAHMATIGRLGGKAVSRDRLHMAEIGRRGGVVVAQDRAHMADIGSVGGTVASRDPQQMAERGRLGGAARRS